MIRATLLINGQYAKGSGLPLISEWQKSKAEPIWIDIEGELNADNLCLLREIGCHDLSIDDVQRKRHPPKVEHFKDNVFILFRGIQTVASELTLEPQQIGFFINDNYLITTHSGRSVSIEQFWENSAVASHYQNSLLLATHIMHNAAGRYLEVVLNFEDKLNDLEDQLLGSEPEPAMKKLMEYRSRLLKLRRIFGYHEKLSSTLLAYQKSSSDHKDIIHAVRDLYDRCERLLNLSGMYYDSCGDLIDGYISVSTYQLNNTMRILTVITAIFIPLSFIAGLYGMNFDDMPELHAPYGYFILLGIMFFVAVSLTVIFRWKKWL
jgi:magnesium transporter